MPKITGRTLLEHRSTTRRRLMETLDALMTERGFESVSMSDVANHSGIRRTTIYNHFTDKEDLLIAFVEEKMSNYLSTTREMLRGVDSSTDRIRIYVRTQLLAERRYLMAPGPPLKDVISPGAGRKLAQHIRQTSDLLRSILDDAIADGTIPEQNTDLAIMLVNGTLTGRRVPQDEPARTEFFLYAERYVLQALGGSMPDEPTDLGPVPQGETAAQRSR
ncbi:TetR/AcrR family transcriptional regulator [Flaviflexus salsibiostraticola]|uniref:TetR/AcrR family transcriptional regulator n=1 Tax=Flaviflexus salsibiostraticola TaxID=1282737 RepID=A0A3Q8WTW5_9ACTO|nr:TetR/AcrR family transcriptional regulator [Flaviflexus salsibiostraticola]AZN30214.1 TetR/AcrR family transcriptional regulator [Flaviflexus salsibiostraticola]